MGLKHQPPNRRPDWLQSYLVSGHPLQRPDQRRVVFPGPAIGGAGIEELLCGRGVGQRNAERLGAFQRQVEVLLVQFDAEARREGALDHALAMHFQDAPRL